MEEKVLQQQCPWSLTLQFILCPPHFHIIHTAQYILLMPVCVRITGLFIQLASYLSIGGFLDLMISICPVHYSSFSLRSEDLHHLGSSKS